MEYLVLCIGNKNGGDDAIGPYIAEKFESNKDMSAIDCDIYPENYTSKVKELNPSKLIIIDSTDMGLSPGEIRIIPIEKIGSMHISTHGIPISILVNYLKLHIKQIFLIGIQPKNMIGPLSDIVKKSGDKLIKIIKNNELTKIKTL
jgi:hydrogenase 3 maturation protease